MEFQRQWEEEHKKREWGRYPNESVIKFIAKNFYYKAENRNDIKILDAGCGIGANAWFLAREGFDVYGFDGSESAVQRLKSRFKDENLYKDRLHQFIVQDALGISYKNDYFDAIIDNSMLPYLDDQSIIQVLKKYRKTLKNGGFFFGGGLHEIQGVYGLDTGVKKGDWMIGEIKQGRLAGAYYHNFFNRDRILSLWKEAGFDRIQINHFIEEYEDPTMRYRYFNVIAQKE